MVFFTGDRAYKLKKPVDLGFLDLPGGEPGRPTRQALSAIRPHGPEHTWRPTRPYMLPG